MRESTGDCARGPSCGGPRVGAGNRGDCAEDAGYAQCPGRAAGDSEALGRYPADAYCGGVALGGGSDDLSGLQQMQAPFLGAARPPWLSTREFLDLEVGFNAAVTMPRKKPVIAFVTQSPMVVIPQLSSPAPPSPEGPAPGPVGGSAEVGG